MVASVADLMENFVVKGLPNLALKILASLTKLNDAELRERFTDDELESILSEAYAGIEESYKRGWGLKSIPLVVPHVFKTFFSDERTTRGLQQIFEGESDRVDFYILEEIFIDICVEKGVDTAGFDFFEAIYQVIKRLEVLLEKDKELAKEFTFSDLDNVYRKLGKGRIKADDTLARHKYLRQFITLNNRLQFQGFPEKKYSIEGPLTPLFVMPRVRDGLRSVTFDRVLQKKENQRLVVLGKPGSGKTVLSRFILFKSAEHLLKYHRDSDPVGLPILVEIRKLDQVLKDKPGHNILDYIYDSFRSDPKLTPPGGFFENYLDGGSALVVFDGLDEVLDEGRRTEIKKMIADFSGRYQGKNTIVVTSRLAGYDRTPFSAKEYRHLTLEDFNDEEIDRFLQNWFLKQSIDSTGAEHWAESLKNNITRSTAILDIARNPMLLTATCIMHREGLPLLVDRFSLYEKITDWILSIRDKQKNINDDEFRLEERQRFLGKIAFHLHSTKKKDVISRDKLDEILIPDFEGIAAYHFLTAESLLDEFLEKIESRSGVFLEVGPGMYGFAHATLQEYFAAQWIANDIRLHPDSQRMRYYMDKYIGDESWHEILLHALNVLPRETARTELRHILTLGEMPPFYVRSIDLENVKCFKGKHFLNLSHKNKHANWTVILGNNGTGKTTLLQSIASLDPLLLRVDARFVNVDKQKQVFDVLYREITDSFLDDSPGKVFYDLKGCSPSIKFFVENIDTIYRKYFDRKELSDFYKLMVYAYGASRKSGEAALGSSTSDRHTNLFEVKDLPNAEEWLMQADYAARKGTGNGAESKLQKIKKILLDILPDVKDFEFKTSDDLKNYVEFLTDYGNVRFKDLSLGYRVMISWVVDLARQMFKRYPDSKDPLAEPAVVLVDEIDLHLHPSWQRDIIHFLSQHFKKTQFIVTAHSPLIVQSAEPINVVLLQKDTNKGSVSISNEVNVSYSGWTIEEILNELMGLEKTDSDKYLQLTEKFQRAISKEDIVTAKKVYHQLDKILHPGNHLRKLMRIQMAPLGGEVTE